MMKKLGHLGLMLMLAMTGAPGGAYAQSAVCKASKRFADNASADVVRLVYRNQDNIAKRIEIYQCSEIFSIIEEHGLTPEARKMGELLMAKANEFIIFDGLIFAKSGNSAMVGPALELGDDRELTVFYTRSIRNFWARYHLLELVNKLSGDLTSKDANGLIYVAANCVAIMENAQEHQDLVKGGDSGQILASQLEESVEENSEGKTMLADEQMLALDKLMDDFLFGYKAPTAEQIAENFEVGIKVAPALKMGLMGWESSGKPRAGFVGVELYQAARKVVDEKCS